MKKISMDLKLSVEEYIDKVLKSVEQSYEENTIDPLYYSDIIYLSSVAISLGKDIKKWDEIGISFVTKLKNVLKITNYTKDQ